MSIFTNKDATIAALPRRFSPGRETGLVENTIAAFNEFVHNDQFASEGHVMAAAYGDAIDDIYTATGKRLKNPWLEDLNFGEARRDVPEEMRQRRLKTFVQDFHTASKELNDQIGGFDVLSEGDILTRVQDEGAELERKRADIQERASAMGLVGSFAGSMGGALLDPPIAMSMFIGAPAAAGVLRTGLIEAGIGAATEALVQPQVQKFRSDLELDSGFDRALLNISAAAGGGFVFGAGIKGLAKFSGWSINKVRNLNKEVIQDADPVTRGARTASERTSSLESQTPYNDDFVGKKDHVARTEKSLNAAVDAVVPDIPERAVAAVKNRGTEPLATGTGVIARVRPDAITVDAKRFQFKEGGDAAGVTDRLQGVKVWDETKAGLAILWEDDAGKLFVADGHQRVGLAKRMGGDIEINAIILRADEGWTDRATMIRAASKNIAEGTGSPIDAAKILRAAPDEIINLPPRSALVRQAQDLTRVSDDAFGMVVNEIVPANYAAIVGRLVNDPDMHLAIMDVLAKTQPENVTQAEAIVRQAMNAGQSREVQSTLFGDEEIATSLFADRARILDKAMKRLRRDKNVFKTLVDEENKISGIGTNRLDTSTNLAQETINGRAIEILQRLAHSTGPISDALNGAAKRARSEGGDIGAVNDFLDAVRANTGTGNFGGGPGRGTGRGPQDQIEGSETSALTDDFLNLRDEKVLETFSDPAGKGVTEQTDFAVKELFDGPDDGDVVLGLRVDGDGETVPASMTRKEMKEEIKADDEFLKASEGCLS